MSRIIKIKGIGVADPSLLTSVSNEQYAARLASLEAQGKAYWDDNAWFRNVGYHSDDCAWLRDAYESKFADNNGGRRPNTANDEDWGKLWELVSAEFRAIPRWTKKYTLIEHRFEARDGVATSDLMASACEAALRVSGLPRELVDGIHLASVSADHPQTPTMAPLVQQRLGIPNTDPEGYLRNISYIDGEAACCSFLVVLRASVAALRNGDCDSALVCGGDVMSRMTSKYSRTFGSLMGDHGGALHLAAEEGPAEEDAFPPGCFFGYLDGSKEDLIKAQAGGSRLSITPEMATNPFALSYLMRMKDGGGPVAEEVRRIVLPGEDFEAHRGTLVLGGLRRAFKRPIADRADFMEFLNKIDLIVLHQANGLMVTELEQVFRERFGYRGQFYDNIQRYANTTSAANLLCLFEAWQKGTLRKGMKVMIVAFGGGFTGMTCVLNWNLPDYADLARAA